MPARAPSTEPTTTDGRMGEEYSQIRQGGLPRMGGTSSEAQTVVHPSALLGGMSKCQRLKRKRKKKPLSLSPFAFFTRSPSNTTARIEVDCQLDTGKRLASACKHSSQSIGRILAIRQLSNRSHIAATLDSITHSSLPFPAIIACAAHNLCIPPSRTKSTQKGGSFGLRRKEISCTTTTINSHSGEEVFHDGGLED